MYKRQFEYRSRPLAAFLFHASSFFSFAGNQIFQRQQFFLLIFPQLILSLIHILIKGNNIMKRNIRNNHSSVLRDYGPNPLTVNINKLSALNQNYLLALWTGNYLQVTLMSIKPGGDIGLEIHPETDQLIRRCV